MTNFRVPNYSDLASTFSPVNFSVYTASSEEVLDSRGRVKDWSPIAASNSHPPPGATWERYREETCTDRIIMIALKNEYPLMLIVDWSNVEVLSDEQYTFQEESCLDKKQAIVIEGEDHEANRTPLERPVSFTFFPPGNSGTAYTGQGQLLSELIFDNRGHTPRNHVKFREGGFAVTSVVPRKPDNATATDYALSLESAKELTFLVRINNIDFSFPGYALRDFAFTGTGENGQKTLLLADDHTRDGIGRRPSVSKWSLQHITFESDVELPEPEMCFELPIPPFPENSR